MCADIHRLNDAPLVTVCNVFVISPPLVVHFFELQRVDTGKLDVAPLFVLLCFTVALCSSFSQICVSEDA